MTTCLDLSISIPGSSVQERSGRSDHQGPSVMRNLDINKVPRFEGDQVEGSASAMNYSTIDDDLEDQSDYEDQNSNGKRVDQGKQKLDEADIPRKKLRLSKEQSRLLEDRFRLNNTLNSKQKQDLATQLKLKARQVEVWFQNRRARSKLKQMETESKYLNRWFIFLTQQNQILQKEIQMLRSTNTTSSVHSQPPPTTTLSLCSPPQQTTATSSFITRICPQCTAITASKIPTAAAATQVMSYKQTSHSSANGTTSSHHMGTGKK